MAFKKRLSAPSASDKYWIHKSKGGLNECILIGGNSCIPNCVGYAWGRFYEITGKRPTLSRRNAEDWFGYTADGYKRGSTPKVGAVICWSKGKTGVSMDGAGHVAIVEQINDDGSIICSESGYKAFRFRTKKYPKNFKVTGYTFLGFIYNPAVSDEDTPTEKKETKTTTKTNTAKSFDEKLAGTYKTTEKLNLRTGAGVDNPSILVIPKGEKVNNFGYYTTVSGVKWLYITCKDKTGFASSKYLTK